MAGIVIQPPGWPAPKGYSNGILFTAGELLTVAGQIGWDTTGKLVGSDFVRQFEQALDNVLAVVKAGGGRPDNIVSMRVYVTDKREYVSRQRELAAVWRERFGRYYPAMSLLQVGALLEEGAKVEIEAVAGLPPRPGSSSTQDADEMEFDPPTTTVSTTAPDVGGEDFDPPTKTVPAVDISDKGDNDEEDE